MSKWIDDTGLARLLTNLKANFAKKSELPTKTSDLTNDSGFLTSYTETDPTVPSWAKASSKPTYTASEVGAAASSHNHAASDINSGTLASARLPIATANALGGIKVGAGLSISDGVLSATGGGSGMTITTLWFNSSPTSSFAAQTITLNSNASNYKLILITFRFSTSAPQEGALVLRYNSSYPDFVLMIGAAANNRTGARDGKFIDSGARIEFTKAGYNGSATNNGYAIPHYIYGLK